MERGVQRQSTLPSKYEILGLVPSTPNIHITKESLI